MNLSTVVSSAISVLPSVLSPLPTLVLLLLRLSTLVLGRSEAHKFNPSRTPTLR